MYSFQTFTLEQILTAAQMNQVEANTRDHIHGRESVLSVGISFPDTAKSGGFTAVAGDIGELFLCTGTFTIDFAAAATLGSGWAITVANVGTGTITLDPNSAETINGKTTLVIAPNASVVILSDGSNLFTVGGGALTLLATATAADSATIDFVSGIDSTYEKYLITIDALRPASDTRTLWCRTTTDASTFDAGASDYAWVWSGNCNTTLNDKDGADNQIDMSSTPTDQMGNLATETWSGVVYISSPANAALHTQITYSGGYLNASGQACALVGLGVRLAAEDVNGIRFLMSIGSITSGEFKLYGISKG